MARRRVRTDIAIFSTSFLDLLFCGLAAVVLLWVIVDPPIEDHTPRIIRFQFVTVGQTGLWHFSGFGVDSQRWTPLDLADKNARSQFSQELLTQKGLVASYAVPDQDTSPSSGTDETGGFAGSLVFGANDQTADCQITITFSRCVYEDYSHPISLQSFSERGHTQAAFLFDNSNESQTATLAAEAADRSLSLPNVADANDTTCVLTFAVSKGRIRLIAATPAKAKALIGFDL